MEFQAFDLSTIFVGAALLFLLCIGSVFAETKATPSRFCHATDGAFTICPDGNTEWSDVTPVFFPESQSYLYADQADFDAELASPDSLLDTFLLMYDEAGRTQPFGPNEYFLVSFKTVEVEDGVEKLEHYVIHIFTDGTIIFIEDGQVQQDESGQARVAEIEGQRGKVGFGPSPNSPMPHVIAEFEIKLSAAAQLIVDGAYSPDPLFWSSDPPRPKVIIVSETTSGNAVTTVVANIGNAPATNLRITQQPFNHADLKLDDKREISGFSLAPGQVRAFMFDGFSEPLKCGYSDVFDASDGLLAATLCETIINPQSPIHFSFVIPYPIFVEETLGTPADFHLEAPALDGLPPGWSVGGLTPTPGEVFRLSPGERIVGQLVLEAPDDAPEGTVARVVVPYVEPITGFRAEIRLAGVVDTTPPLVTETASRVTPTLALRLTARVADNACTVGDVIVEYSTDHGVMLTPQRMEIAPPTELVSLGLASSGFETQLGPFVQGTEVRWKVIAHDRCRNETQTDIAVTVIEAPETPIGVLFGTDASGGSLLTIDPATGSGTIIGSMGVGVVPALAIDPTIGIMYAGGGAGRPNLYTVDPTTASATLVGDSGLGFAAVGGMDFGPDGTLYAAVNIAGDGRTGSDHLAILDKGTGTATVLGHFGTCEGVTIPSFGGGSCTIEGIEGVAFDALGVLWGALTTRGRAGAPGLYTIDPVTGTATFVAPIVDASGAPPSGGVVSLEFGSDGTLFGGTATAVFPATDGGRLITIDPVTGRFAFVGSVSATGGSSLGALALRGTIVTPVSDDRDADDVPDELDNCPGIVNTGQQDSELNGIGDACQTPDEEHGTAVFLQAHANGSTTVEPISLTIGAEPELLEQLTRIVDFRVDAGLATSASELTANLVESLVQTGVVQPDEADELVRDVLQQITLQVVVDIKPDSSSNPINLRNKGVVPVAILTTAVFDAVTVDPLSIRFGPGGATESHGRGHLEDVDGDHDLDLLLHFRTTETGITPDDTQACLIGKTSDGVTIEGCDTVRPQ